MNRIQRRWRIANSQFPTANGAGIAAGAVPDAGDF